MKAYLSVFRVRFSLVLQYRAAALAGVVTQFAWGFMELLAFRAFYNASPGGFDMTYTQLASYIWLQQAFLALFMTWFFEREIFDSITSGSISYELARPLDLYGRWFTQSMANRLSRAALRCMPILAVAFFIPGPMRMTLPPTFAQGVMFIASVTLGLAVVCAWCMLIYITTFFTLSSVGVRLVAASLGDFLAGAIIPLPFFPPAFRRIAELLPFAAMQNMPLRIYAGNIAGAHAVRGLLLQVFWLAVLVIIGRLLMKKALTRVVVQGG